MGSIRTYAIGDIHGRLDKLRQVHGWIAADIQQFSGEVQVVHIGDLVDRGPDSAGVVGWLMAGIAAGEPWQVLKGNHDRMMTLFLEDPPHPDPCLRADLTWLDPRLGGLTTLASYGVDIAGAVGLTWRCFTARREIRCHSSTDSFCPICPASIAAMAPRMFTPGCDLVCHWISKARMI